MEPTHMKTPAPEDRTSPMAEMLIRLDDFREMPAFCLQWRIDRLGNLSHTRRRTGRP